MPLHIAGTNFRPGAGLVVRFGGAPARGTGSGACNTPPDASSSTCSSSSSEQRTSVAVVPAVFVSSAVLAVEPPATAHPEYQDVPMQVSVNAGITFGVNVMYYREEIPI
jgi:hypothetical protein